MNYVNYGVVLPPSLMVFFVWCLCTHSSSPDQLHTLTRKIFWGERKWGDNQSIFSKNCYKEFQNEGGREGKGCLDLCLNDPITKIYPDARIIWCWMSIMEVKQYGISVTGNIDWLLISSLKSSSSPHAQHSLLCRTWRCRSWRWLCFLIIFLSILLDNFISTYSSI